MRRKVIVIPLLGMVLSIRLAFTQGIFIYDQESSSDEASTFSSALIQFYGSVSQSFTPSLTKVDFVRLRLFDVTQGNAQGAILVVNLRSEAVNGPIMGTTMPVSLVDGFRSATNFLFSSSISVVPNTTYFLETIVQSGDSWGITALGDVYPKGNIYGGQQPFPGNDLWFREGIVVPEPSVAVLLLGGGVIGWLFRKRQRR